MCKKYNLLFKLFISVAASAPVFSRPLSDEAVQYGVLSHPVKVCISLQGSPAPNVTWFFNGQKLDCDDRYNSYPSPGGEVVLEFLDMGPKDVGQYKVIAENEEGSAERVISLEMAGMLSVSVGVFGNKYFSSSIVFFWKL